MSRHAPVFLRPRAAGAASARALDDRRSRAGAPHPRAGSRSRAPRAGGSRRAPLLRRAVSVGPALSLGRARALRSKGRSSTVSLLLEPHGALVDDLAEQMSADEAAGLRHRWRTALAEICSPIIERCYAWALATDFTHADTGSALLVRVGREARAAPRRARCTSRAPTWSSRLPSRGTSRCCRPHSDRSPPTRPLAPISCGSRSTATPSAARRSWRATPTPRSATTSSAATCAPSTFCAASSRSSASTRFDPRSDKWLRITLFQGAPFPDEIAERDWD